MTSPDKTRLAKHDNSPIISGLRALLLVYIHLMCQPNATGTVTSLTWRSTTSVLTVRQLFHLQWQSRFISANVLRKIMLSIGCSDSTLSMRYLFQYLQRRLPMLFCLYPASNVLLQRIPVSFKTTKYQGYTLLLQRIDLKLKALHVIATRYSNLSKSTLHHFHLFGFAVVLKHLSLSLE